MDIASAAPSVDGEEEVDAGGVDARRCGGGRVFKDLFNVVVATIRKHEAKHRDT
mgnify:CR=1 FL=1